MNEGRQDQLEAKLRYLLDFMALRGGYFHSTCQIKARSLSVLILLFMNEGPMGFRIHLQKNSSLI